MTESVATASLHDSPDLARLRQFIGVEQPVVGWNSSAHADGVRHFAHGYGDDNPWWGGSAVPPSFLYSVCSGGRAAGHPGPAEILGDTGALWLTDDWRYLRPVRPGSALSATVRLAEVTLKDTRSRGPVVLLDEVFTFRDDLGVLADYTKRTMRFARRPAGLASTLDPLDGAPMYGVDRLDEIAREVLAERDRRRGPVERPVSSVNVGDDLGTIVKGPLSLTSVIAWVAGWGSPYIETDRLAHARWQSDPSLRLTVPSTGRPESIEAPHWDSELAGVAGLSRGYDFGSQRMAWLMHLATDWAGDAGAIVAMRGQLTKPNLLGDLSTITGHVTAIAGSTVECRVLAHNQRGEETANATISVRLPDDGARN